jgi:6-phosphofructokinase 2
MTPPRAFRLPARALAASVPGVLTVATITMSPSVDYTLTIPHLVPEEKLRARVEATEPGGGGVQVARALRRLDEPVEAIVALGGNVGATLENLLTLEGVPIHPIRVAANTRPSLTIFVEDQGVNFRVVGEAGEQTESEWRQVLDRMWEFPSLPPYVVLSGSFPPGVPTTLVREIAGVCRERRSNLVFDGSGEALQFAVEEKVELIKPSKEELAALVGQDGYDPDFDYRKAARQVVDSGVPILVVSLGSAGTYVLSAAGDEARVRPPKVRVASTVAAGDSTVAGLVAGLARGLPIVDAVRLGTACGTGTVLHHGSQLFTPENVTAIMPELEVERISSAIPPA